MEENLEDEIWYPKREKLLSKARTMAFFWGHTIFARHGEEAKGHWQEIEQEASERTTAMEQCGFCHPTVREGRAASQWESSSRHVHSFELYQGSPNACRC